MTPFALVVFEAVVAALPFLGGVAQSFGWMDVGLGDGLLVGLGLGGRLGIGRLLLGGALGLVVVAVGLVDAELDQVVVALGFGLGLGIAAARFLPATTALLFLVAVTSTFARALLLPTAIFLLFLRRLTAAAVRFGLLTTATSSGLEEDVVVPGRAQQFSIFMSQRAVDPVGFVATQLPVVLLVLLHVAIIEGVIGRQSVVQPGCHAVLAIGAASIRGGAHKDVLSRLLLLLTDEEHNGQKRGSSDIAHQSWFASGPPTIGVVTPTDHVDV